MEIEPPAALGAGLHRPETLGIDRHMPRGRRQRTTDEAIARFPADDPGSHPAADRARWEHIRTLRQSHEWPEDVALIATIGLEVIRVAARHTVPTVSRNLITSLLVHLYGRFNAGRGRQRPRRQSRRIESTERRKMRDSSVTRIMTGSPDRSTSGVVGESIEGIALLALNQREPTTQGTNTCEHKATRDLGGERFIDQPM
jgi:hypothetical protein